jgi:hypothetical protein
MSEIKFNVNHQVKVKLTPYGVSCLYKNHQRQREIWDKSNVNQFTVRLDGDGYYRTQLWSLMQEFGEHICLSRTPFETEVILLNE